MNLSPEEEKRQQEKTAYAKTVRAWYAAYKNVRMYSAEHPTALDAAQKCATAVQDVLTLRFDFVLQHIDGLFVVDDILLIEESLAFYDLLRAFEKADVSKLVFLPGVTAKEIIGVIKFFFDV
jgi:hypothetical protein